MSPKWVTFSTNILRQRSNFGLKKSLEEDPISQKLEKKWKISVFEVEKPSEMGHDLCNILEKQISRFLMEENP